MQRIGRRQGADPNISRSWKYCEPGSVVSAQVEGRRAASSHEKVGLAGHVVPLNKSAGRLSKSAVEVGTGETRSVEVVNSKLGAGGLIFLHFEKRAGGRGTNSNVTAVGVANVVAARGPLRLCR